MYSASPRRLKNEQKIMGRACSVKLERTTIMKVKEKIIQKINQATKMLSVAAP